MEICAHVEYLIIRPAFGKRKDIKFSGGGMLFKNIDYDFLFVKESILCLLLQYGGVDGLQFLRDIPKDVLRPLYDELDRQIHGLDQVCISNIL